MGHPILLYGTGQLKNHSFEEPGIDAQLPTDWLGFGGLQNGIYLTSNTFFQSAGRGIPSEYSLLQYVTTDVAGNNSKTNQRLDLTNLIPYLQSSGQELAVMAMCRPTEDIAYRNAELNMYQYQSDGDPALPFDGTQNTPPTERHIRYGDSGPWYLFLTAQKVHADTKYVDISLEYNMDNAGFYAGSAVHWDRVFVGGLVDFSKGFKSIEESPNPGYGVNYGNAIAEIIKISSVQTALNLTLANVDDCSPLAQSMRAFVEWQQFSKGYVTFWGDREKFTNFDRHYQQTVVQPGNKSLRVVYPSGVVRRNYSMSLIAYAEGNA